MPSLGVPRKVPRDGTDLERGRREGFGEPLGGNQDSRPRAAADRRAYIPTVGLGASARKVRGASGLAVNRSQARGAAGFRASATDVQAGASLRRAAQRAGSASARHRTRRVHYHRPESFVRVARGCIMTTYGIRTKRNGRTAPGGAPRRRSGPGREAYVAMCAALNAASLRAADRRSGARASITPPEKAHPRIASVVTPSLQHLRSSCHLVVKRVLA